MSFWQTLTVGFGMMLIIEGIFPLINPLGYKKYVLQIGMMQTRAIRLFGLVSLLGGAVVFHLAK